mgnify:CR=1 FL=1
MEIIYKSLGGNCPVQAEGTINGHGFYFRSRGEYWYLYVNRIQEEDVTPAEDGDQDTQPQEPPVVDEEEARMTTGEEEEEGQEQADGFF